MSPKHAPYVQLALEHTWQEFKKAHAEFNKGAPNSRQLQDIIQRRSSLMHLRIEELEQELSQLKKRNRAA